MLGVIEEEPPGGLALFFSTCAHCLNTANKIKQIRNFFGSRKIMHVMGGKCLMYFTFFSIMNFFSRLTFFVLTSVKDSLNGSSRDISIKKNFQKVILKIFNTKHSMTIFFISAYHKYFYVKCSELYHNLVDLISRSHWHLIS